MYTQFMYWYQTHSKIMGKSYVIIRHSRARSHIRLLRFKVFFLKFSVSGLCFRRLAYVGLLVGIIQNVLFDQFSFTDLFSEFLWFFICLVFNPSFVSDIVSVFCFHFPDVQHVNRCLLCVCVFRLFWFQNLSFRLSLLFCVLV